MNLSNVRSLTLSFLTLASLATVASAGTHVKDDAGMFSPAAAQQAEQQLAATQQRGGKNVIIETMGEPPAAVRDRIVADASQRNAAILQLAENRAASAGADVYVLINKTPGNLQIAERKSLQSSGLPAAVRSQVADAMLGAFKAKQFDQGLATGVSMLSGTLGGGGGAMNAPPAMPNVATPNVTPPVSQSRRDDPTPTPPAAPFPNNAPTASRGFGGLGCCTIAGIGLLAVLAIAVFRRMSNRGGPTGGANYGGGVPPVGGYPQGGAYPQQGGYPPQAGGGFGRGVAGGVLGGVLGSVLGNQMSHGHDNSGQSQGGGILGGGGGGGTPQDTDYTGSGGDFDNATGGSSSNSGGDFGNDVGGGGGASDYTGGGGDFSGGGDSGGGGGDSGSSGGDF